MVRDGHVEGRGVDPMMIGQQPTQQGGLVIVVGARPVAIHLLQGDEITMAQRSGDAGHIVATVAAKAVLDVEAGELHGGRLAAPRAFHQCVKAGFARGEAFGKGGVGVYGGAHRQGV